MIVVDVIDLADIAVIQHFFYEMEFGLETRVPGGTFENNEVFVFLGFFNECRSFVSDLSQAVFR